MHTNRISRSACCAGAAFVLCCGAANADPTEWKSIDVAVSAYNSVPAQTSRAKPALAAWGDVLKPGMRAVAVSRDLIKKGLTYGTKVRIEGLSGVYTVRDKMSSRFTKKIDIYMGRNVARARDWGIRHDVRIRYVNSGDS